MGRLPVPVPMQGINQLARAGGQALQNHVETQAAMRDALLDVDPTAALQAFQGAEQEKRKRHTRLALIAGGTALTMGAGVVLLPMYVFDHETNRLAKGINNFLHEAAPVQVNILNEAVLTDIEVPTDVPVQKTKGKDVITAHTERHTGPIGWGITSKNYSAEVDPILDVTMPQNDIHLVAKMVNGKPVLENHVVLLGEQQDEKVIANRPGKAGFTKFNSDGLQVSWAIGAPQQNDKTGTHAPWYHVGTTGGDFPKTNALKNYALGRWAQDFAPTMEAVLAKNASVALEQQLTSGQKLLRAIDVLAAKNPNLQIDGRDARNISRLFNQLLHNVVTVFVDENDNPVPVSEFSQLLPQTLSIDGLAKKFGVGADELKVDNTSPELQRAVTTGAAEQLAQMKKGN